MYAPVCVCVFIYKNTLGWRILRPAPARAIYGHTLIVKYTFRPYADNGQSTY